MAMMDVNKFHDLLSELLKYKHENLSDNDFLLTWEKSLDDLKTVIQVSQIIRFMRENNI